MFPSLLALRSSLFFVLLVWGLSTALWIAPGITLPDGAGYYVYLPSTWFDRDLVFFDEWAELGMVREGRILHKEVTRTGHLGNHWTVGSAVFWFPSFVAGEGLRLLPPLRRFARNGFSLPYNVPVVFASAMAGLLTLLIGYRIACELSGSFAAALAAVGAWLGTPLIWYALRQGVMSHAISALGAALVFACALYLRRREGLAPWVLTGFAAGFAFAVRPQNAPLALVPFFVAGRGMERRGAKLAAYGAAALAASVPQWVVSSYIYGSPFAYLWGGEATPFAAFERIWSWEPLLSWYHGLFPWSPFALLGVAGLVMLFRRDRGLASAALFVFLAQWMINATLERSFWGAYSFGQRRFDNCIIVFLIGAAVLFSLMPRWLAVFSAVLTSLWSLSLFLAALDGIDLSRYYRPVELLRMQMEALGDLPSYLRLLGAVPPALRMTVGLLLIVCALLWVGVFIPLRRLSPRNAVILCGIYVTLMSAWFAASGSKRNIAAYQDLIAANRALMQIPGGADARVELLSDELEYLRKSGRERLAEETARELRELEAAREKAQRQLRSE